MKKAIETLLFAGGLVLASMSPIEDTSTAPPYKYEVYKPVYNNTVDVKLWGVSEKTEQATEESATTTEYSEDDILLLERVTMSEASVEPYDCKVATCVTVLKRAKKGKTISEVVYAPYQYSVADNGYPTAEVKEAVQDAIRMEGEYPDGMIYFRADRFHDFGTPYMVYGNHYFSLEN